MVASAHLFKIDIRAVNIGNEDLMGMRKIKINWQGACYFRLCCMIRQQDAKGKSREKL